MSALAAVVLALAACGGGGSAPGGVLAVPGGVQNQSSLGSVLSPATGTIASGYIECDTAVNIAAGNDCNDYANFVLAAPPGAGGTFVFTVIAANASGTPIAQQLVGGTAAMFSNGAYQVVESRGDDPPILSVSGGPWTAPGAVLTGAEGAYGNHASIACVHPGTGNLELRLVNGSNAQPLPLATQAFRTNTTTVNCSASGTVSLF